MCWVSCSAFIIFFQSLGLLFRSSATSWAVQYEEHRQCAVGFHLHNLEAGREHFCSHWNSKFITNLDLYYIFTLYLHMYFLPLTHPLNFTIFLPLFFSSSSLLVSYSFSLSLSFPGIYSGKLLSLSDHTQVWGPRLHLCSPSKSVIEQWSNRSAREDWHYSLPSHWEQRHVPYPIATMVTLAHMKPSSVHGNKL